MWQTSSPLRETPSKSSGFPQNPQERKGHQDPLQCYQPLHGLIAVCCSIMSEEHVPRSGTALPLCWRFAVNICGTPKYCTRCLHTIQLTWSGPKSQFTDTLFAGSQHCSRECGRSSGPATLKDPERVTFHNSTNWVALSDEYLEGPLGSGMGSVFSQQSCLWQHPQDGKAHRVLDHWGGYVLDSRGPRR